eukprot:CAMPEP_0113935006 /NCGR_PEP_ID=MMETSP1339-20121228/2246_1 /TAXON_ID=94617 /ORGANISM="Fibrocapsa japonica" /LENGTH=60 /DNA_ID=CAMNT_0000937017 /DNA_START=865 /DNA_END=1047 /DNA_ORIENTATION=+ /assembly_acc=CAM_ASM_000762
MVWVQLSLVAGGAASAEIVWVQLSLCVVVTKNLGSRGAPGYSSWSDLVSFGLKGAVGAGV